MNIEVGKVVLVETASAAALGLMKRQFSKHPETGQQGNWHWVNVAGVDYLAAQASILDEDPACEECGGKRWWWTGSFQIRCAECVRPFPAWSAMWRDFEELLERLAQKFGDSAQGVANVVALADLALIRGDWCLFLKAHTIAGIMATVNYELGEDAEDSTL